MERAGCLMRHPTSSLTVLGNQRSRLVDPSSTLQINRYYHGIGFY